MARKLYDPETVKSILQNCNNPAEREQKAAELREKANRWPPGLSRAGHIYVKTYTLEDSCLIRILWKTLAKLAVRPIRLNFLAYCGVTAATGPTPSLVVKGGLQPPWPAMLPHQAIPFISHNS
jgi:hypothetical protein